MSTKCIGFVDRFAEDISAGRKRSTIRPQRQKNPFRVGDRLKLYTGWRTRNAHLRREVICAAITEIRLVIPERKILLRRGKRRWLRCGIQSVAIGRRKPSTTGNALRLTSSGSSSSATKPTALRVS